MKKTIKRITAALLSAAALGVCTVTAGARVNDDPNPGASKSWEVTCVGGGAPSNADTISRFWVYNSSGGHIGNCTTLTSLDTEFGVRVECIDGKHTISVKTWNRKGEKTWQIGEPSYHVRYEAHAYGKYTYSEGTVTRI